MECMVYKRTETFRGSGPAYRHTSMYWKPMGNLRYMIQTRNAYRNKLSGAVVRVFVWYVRGSRFDPQLGQIIICIFYRLPATLYPRELNCNNCLLDNT